VSDDNRKLAWATEWLFDRLLETHAHERAAKSSFEALDEAYAAAVPWSDVPLFEVPGRVPAAVAESVPVATVERPVCTDIESKNTTDITALEAPVEAGEQPEQAIVKPAKAARQPLFRRKPLAEKRVSRQQRFDHKLNLLEDKGNYATSAIQIRGQVERARLQSRGERAYARRQIETAPHVLADRLARQRRRATVIAGLIITAAMAFTSVNVQEFIAGATPSWEPLWVAGWLVDPAATGLVVWLLWTRADMAAVNMPINEARETFTVWVMTFIELVTLLAIVAMNIAPEIEKTDTELSRVIVHLAIPLVGVAAIFSLPLIQSLYADRINRITGVKAVASPVTAQIVRNPDEQPKPSNSGGLSERAQKGVSEIYKAIEKGKLALPLSVNKVADFVRSTEVGKCSIPTAQEIVRHLQNDSSKLTAN
jgi:hypothetical protein